MTCVLVVDGDRSASAAIQALLELEGFEVVVADGGHLHRRPEPDARTSQDS